MSFHTKNTAYLTNSELYIIYGFLIAFVICSIGYFISFGGII